MTDYGIKISKEGQNVFDTLTEANKKNFIILDATNSLKIVYAGFISSTSYTHDLNYVPWVLAFAVDSTTSPTYFERIHARVTSTQVLNLTNPSYIIIFHKDS